jgi:hypothetical protein
VPFLDQQLGTDASVSMVPLAQLGILFCAWTRMSELQGGLSKMLRDMRLFQHTQVQLSTFDVPGYRPIDIEKLTSPVENRLADAG